MKKTALTFTVLTAFFTAILFSCNSQSSSNIDDLTGKWQRSDIDTLKLVIEITEESEWKYYQDDEMLEKGKLELIANKFIMKHDVEDHAHDHDGDHDHHDHHHPEDHVYDYSLNDDKSELSIISENRTTVYKKIQ